MAIAAIAIGADPVADTTPRQPISGDHDRIDFVYALGAAQLEGSAIVGEGAAYADIVVSRWPSDHRAVVTEFLVP